MVTLTAKAAQASSGLTKRDVNARPAFPLVIFRSWAISRVCCAVGSLDTKSGSDSTTSHIRTDEFRSPCMFSSFRIRVLACFSRAERDDVIQYVNGEDAFVVLVIDEAETHRGPVITELKCEAECLVRSAEGVVASCERVDGRDPCLLPDRATGQRFGACLVFGMIDGHQIEHRDPVALVVGRV